jgi:nucleotide-binding universal stress UspA family protein
LKILVAVDGSPYTKRMLAYLAAHDEWLGDAHHYTRAAHRAPGAAARCRGARQAGLKDYYEDEAEKVFKPIRSFFAKQGIKATYVVQGRIGGRHHRHHGRQGRFDLLMMGSHGHGTLTNLVMGSVATKVLANCSTPVLLIR